MAEKIELVTTAERAATAAERWKKQYFYTDDWDNDHCRKNIYDKLIQLGDTPSPEAVNEIIGNDTWTEVSCEHCRCKPNTVIAIPREYDYHAHFCINCLREAVALFKKGGK